MKCSLAKVSRRSRRTSETSESLYQTTNCHSLKYGSLHTYRGLMLNGYQISTKHNASMFRVDLLPSVNRLTHIPRSHSHTYPDDEGSILPQSFASCYQTTPSHIPEDHNLKISIKFQKKYSTRTTESFPCTRHQGI
jgi:hypothetical protein